MPSPAGSLPDLERFVAKRKHQEALAEALQILLSVDRQMGLLDPAWLASVPVGSSADDQAVIFCTRFAAAFGHVVTDSDLVMSPLNYELLLLQHRWVDLIFSLSGFRGSDYLHGSLATDGAQDRMTMDGPNFSRLLAILSMSSRIDIDLDQFWIANPVSVTLAFLNYLMTRCVFTSRAFALRERLLEWLPNKLADLRLGGLTLSRICDPYLHCSYAMSPHKHEIKRALIMQMRRACLDVGAVEMTAPLPVSGEEKPTVVVVGEYFKLGHSVFRTHSRAVQSLRRRFRVVGVIFPAPSEPEVLDLFDEIIALPDSEFLPMVRALSEAIVARKPALILYLGVGMFSAVIGLASLRLAPIQCVSFGHTATTMSPVMDYFILPEDFVVAPDTFSEKVVSVPKEAMPMAPLPFKPIAPRSPDGKIRVAITASVMKLNPYLFDAVARIASGVKRPVELHFFPLAGAGLAWVELSRVVKALVPGATVFQHAPQEVYMQRLAACDLFLCPFPYGNMNSIVDCFRYGLPGVCLDGREAHAHADAAFFARIGLPAELAAQSIDDYVGAAIKLIDDEQWRKHCGSIAAHADLDAAFFADDANGFCDAVASLIRPRES